MPWWKQGTGYSEKGRKDRRLSMSERVWPVACRECTGSAAAGLSPSSWLLAALRTWDEIQDPKQQVQGCLWYGRAARPIEMADWDTCQHPGGPSTCMTTGCGTARVTASCVTC